jgi:hypothetical protein
LKHQLLSESASTPEGKGTNEQSLYQPRNPGAGCAFSALAPEIARSDKRTRAVTSDQVKADLELIVGVAARQG